MMGIVKSSQKGKDMTRHHRVASAFTSGMGELIGSGGHHREKASMWLMRKFMTLMAMGRNKLWQFWTLLGKLAQML